MKPTANENHSHGNPAHSDSHSLYREAVARASRPQPLVLHTLPNSVLLTAPNNIIFELFNTITKEITSLELDKYINDHLKQYLIDNWTNKALQNAIIRLRRELEIDKRAKSPASAAAPNISKFNNVQIIDCKQLKLDRLHKSPQRLDQPNAEKSRSLIAAAKSISPTDQHRELSSRETVSKVNANEEIIDQVYRHIIWRITTQKISQITSLIIKFAIDDGYKRGKIKAQIYDDVKANFADWRSDKLIKLYAFGNLPPNDQRLILANTTAGRLTKYIANYIDGSEKKENNDLIRVLASALRDKTKNCILLTNDLDYALKSLETNALRTVFVIDRDKNYEKDFQRIMDEKPQLVFLITSGKIFFISSLNCVQFVPDPTTMECC